MAAVRPELWRRFDAYSYARNIWCRRNPPGLTHWLVGWTGSEWESAGTHSDGSPWYRPRLPST